MQCRHQHYVIANMRQTILLCYSFYRYSLYVSLCSQIFYESYKLLCVDVLCVDVSVCCVLLNELTAWFYVVTHQH